MAWTTEELSGLSPGDRCDLVVMPDADETSPSADAMVLGGVVAEVQVVERVGLVWGQCVGGDLVIGWEEFFLGVTEVDGVTAIDVLLPLLDGVHSERVLLTAPDA